MPSRIAAESTLRRRFTPYEEVPRTGRKDLVQVDTQGRAASTARLRVSRVPAPLALSVGSVTQHQAALFPIRQKLVLVGHMPGKKNLWKVGRGGRMYLDQHVKAQIDWITLQARQQWQQRPHVDHPNLVIRFFAYNAGSDEDGKYTTLCDCLQAAGVIKNDNFNHFSGMKVLEPAVIVGDPRQEKTEIYIEVG